MELLTPTARQLSSYGSSGVQLLRAALVREPQDGFAVDVVRLAPGGSIGRHPTRLWLLFLVVSGRGWVSGASGDRRPKPATLAGGALASVWAEGDELGAVRGRQGGGGHP